MMKNLNRLLVLYAFIGVLVFGYQGDMFGKSIPVVSKKQARLLDEEYIAIKSGDLLTAAAKASAAGTDHGLDENYCADDASFVMTPTFNEVELSGGYWKGAPDEPWVDPATGEFIPSNVPEASLGNFIPVTYIVDDAMGTPQEFRDYTKVQPLPTAYDLSGPDELCGGQSITLTLSGSQGSAMYYLMRDPDFDGPLVSSVYSSMPGTDGSLDFSVSAGGRYTIEAEQNYVDADCRNVMNNVLDVTEHALPNPTASNDSPVCEGGDVNLTGGPGSMVSYSWSGPDSYSSSEQSPLISDIALAGDGVYTLTVVDGNGCTNDITTTITVNANPSITAGSNSPICEDSDINLTSTPSGGSGTYNTFAWTGPNSFSSGDQNPTIAAATTAATGTYRVTVTDDLGCSTTAEATTDVVVNTRPTVSLSYNDKVCLNTNLILTANPAGGSGNFVNYVWRKGGAVIGSGISSTFTVTSSAALSDAGNYSVTVEDDSGCISDEDFEVVTIYGLPTATASNDGPLCEGEDLSLTGGPAVMTTYSWSGPNSYSSSSQSPSITGITLAGDGVYTLTVTDGNGCTDSESTTVIVNENPTITAGSDSPICQGSDLHLTSTPAGGSGTYDTFLWSGPNSFSSGAEDPTILAATTAATGTYSVTVTDDLGCSSVAAATTDVTVNERQTVSLSYNDKVCLNTSLVLTAAPAGGSGNYVNYVWRKGGTIIGNGISSTFTVTSSAALSDAGNYSVTVEDDSGCVSDEDFEVVTIYGLPTATASNNGPLCEGEDLSLSGGPAAMTTYSWSGPNSYSSGSQSPSITGITLAGDGVYTLTVTDGNGCTDSESTTVIVNENPTITAGSDSPICQGSDLHLTSTPAGGSGIYDTFLWSGPNSFSSGAEDPTIVAATSAATGTYSVTVTDDLGCSSVAAATTEVTVNVRPTASLSYNDKVCLNTSLVLTAASAGGSGNYVNYVWRKEGVVIGSGNSNTYTVTSSAALSDAGNYSVTVEDDNGCISDEDIELVNVYNLPIVTASNNGPLCEGEDLILTGGPGAMDSYSWTGPDSFTSGSQSSTVSGVDINNAGTYTLTVIDANTCSASTTTDVTVNQIQSNISVSAPQPGATEACAGVDVTFNAAGSLGSGNYSYDFHRIRGGVDQSVHTGSTTYTTPDLQDGDQVYVIATDNNTLCTDASNIITMSINANPVPALNITSAGGNVICLGSTVDFVASPGFDRYIYYRNGSEVVQDGASNTYSTSTLADGDQISVVAYDSDCFGASPAVTMTVHDLPTVSLSGDASTVCENQDVLFTATGTGTGSLTYQFLVDGNPETGIQAGNTFAWHSLNDFSVEVRIFDGNNCENISSAVDVTISKPVATLSADRTEICDGEEIVFTAGGGVGYEFFVNTVSTQGPDVSDEFRSTTLANNDNVTVTITDTYGCTADHSGIAITVNPIPVPTLTSSDADNIICATDEVTFTAGGGDVFEFFVDGVSVQGPGNQATYVTSSLNDGEKVSAEVSFSTSGCAATSAEITTTVNPLPTVGLSSDQVDDEFCLGTNVTFTATGATNYEFFVDGTSVQGPGLSDTYSDNSLLDGQVVSVIGTDGNSCENSASITVVVNEATATLTSDLGNSICEGVEVTFTATGGVTYEFFVDGISVQAASATDTYVTNSLSDGETVSVTVTDVNGCIDNADIVMTVIAAPILSLSSSELDLEICQGDEVTFTASGASTYEFFLNGSSIQGPGTETQYITTTLNDGDIVYVVGNDGTCNGTSPDITTVVNPLPTATLSAVPGTSIIAGTNVAFTAGGGTEYVFAVNGTVVQSRSADNTYESNSLVDGDVVSVDVYDGNNCMSSESLTIRVFDSVILLGVSATNDSKYCYNESGLSDVSVYVEGTPQDGITYELFRTSDNSKVEPSIMYSSTSPTPIEVRWDNIAGTDEYRVEAFYTDVPAERFEMNNRVTITEYPLPVIYNMTPTGEVTGCNGGAGHVISIDNSQTGVDYTLWLNGNIFVETKSGVDGSQIDFSAQNVIGTYTVLAHNATSGCERYMSGQLVIKSDVAESPFNIYVVNPDDASDYTSKDGRYCEDSEGINIGLDETLDNTVTYLLYKDGIYTGISQAGAADGSAITFGLDTWDEGNYMVRVESASGCQFPMTGSVDVSIIPTPSAFNLVADNDGHFCDGEAGVTFSIDDQEEGVEYSLYINGTTLLETVTGTDAAGSSLIFTGVYNTEGTYSVEAVVPEVGCTNAMNNTVEVVMDGLPTVYDLTSDGDYCSGDVTYIHLPGSQSDVEYRWHNLDDDSYGPAVIGTGGILDIEISNTGNYEITARRTDGITSCESVMNGTFAITEKPLPEDRFISETYEGTGCGDGSIVTVIMSQAGVQYTLVKKVGTEYYDAGLPVITGDGNDIDFAAIIDKDNAEYTAMATLDGCSIYLSGSVFIDIAGVVTKQVVTGEGEICNGDPGVVFGLEDTEAGVTYELWLSHKYGVVGETAEETIVGDGNSMSFPLVNGEGEYLVAGISATCELEMANRVELNVNPLPEAYKMIGSGEFCDPADGAEISLDNSEEGVSYMLQYFNGSILDDKLDVPAVGGADTDTITFGKFTDIGTYTVIATTDKGCTSSMNGEVETHQSLTPIDQTVDYDSNVYCEGEGIEFRLTDHEAGVIYQVIDDASVVIAEVEGTSSGELSLGIFTEGTYSFQATRGGDACITTINGGIDITITSKAMPTEHEVTVDNEKICGSIGATITLDGFEVDRKYRIEASYGAILDTITGTDRDPISWVVTEPVSGEETYEIWAMSMIDGECDSLMMGVVEVEFKEIPESFNVVSEYEGIDYIVDYCEGADSIRIRIENTQVDVAYMLVDTIDVNTALDVIIGNGSDQYYTKHFGEGGYTVKSILYTTGCEVLYNDTIEIKKNPTPTIEIFQIGDLDCSSEVCYGLVDSDELILDNSAPEEDVTVYSLLLNGAAIDPSVDSLSTGGPINFGSRSEDGIYTVQAISNMGCPAIMDGIIRLEQYPLNAEDDYLNLAKGENTGSVIVPGSDELTNDTWNPAIDYLYDPEVEGEGNLRFWFSPNSAVVAKDIESGSVIIDEKTGVLVYTKLPGFYGRDSVTYYFKNIDYPDTRPRIDSAKVYIFVGNKGIEEGKTFLIPNAFSPNGDDINDYFKISGIEEDGRYSAEKSKLEVFNRWGSLVYRSKGNTYGEDGEWWDGTSTTANMVSIGSDLPNGTYFYVYSVEVNVTGEDKTSVKEYSGYIELRR